MTQGTETGAPHVWRFFRAGGFDQVRLDTSGDIVAVPTLDQKLWVALACPTRGLEFDQGTLDLIDADHDGRIRAPEMTEAVGWVAGLLKNPDDLLSGRAALALAAINDAAPEGQEIRDSARAMLRVLGKEDAAEISLQDMGDIERLYNATAFNGDGIVPLDSLLELGILSPIECRSPIPGGFRQIKALQQIR